MPWTRLGERLDELVAPLVAAGWLTVGDRVGDVGDFTYPPSVACNYRRDERAVELEYLADGFLTFFADPLRPVSDEDEGELPAFTTDGLAPDHLLELFHAHRLLP